MADALPAAPDAEAIRRRLVEQIQAPPEKLQAYQYNPDFDASLGKAYSDLSTKYSNLDLNDQRINSDYETNRSGLTQRQEEEAQQLENYFADRGTLFSGARVSKGAELTDKYTKLMQQLSEARSRGLEDDTRQRTAAYGAYQTGISDLERGYSASVQDFLAKLAAEDAAAKEKATAEASAKQLQAQVDAQAAAAAAPPAVSVGGGGGGYSAPQAAVQRRVAAPAPKAPVPQAPIPSTSWLNGVGMMGGGGTLAKGVTKAPAPKAPAPKVYQKGQSKAV